MHIEVAKYNISLTLNSICTVSTSSINLLITCLNEIIQNLFSYLISGYFNTLIGFNLMKPLVIIYYIY